MHIASTFGLLLGCSLVAGLLAERFHLPKVTAYLMVGLLLGPSALDWIHRDHVEDLKPMLQLAMAMVLFNLGCQFPLRRVRRIASRALLLSTGEILGTFLLVAGGLLLIGETVTMAVLLGALALATAPATTVLVFKEYESEGPVTEFASALVALNNLASIVVFEVSFLLVSAVHDDLNQPFWREFAWLLRDIFGSILAGIVSGIVVSYACGLLSSGRWLVTLVAVTTLLLGICESFDIPYLLTFLVAGVTVANLSDLTDQIEGELDHLTGLLCVLFFAVHGAELDLSKFAVLGMTGAAYIVCRCTGKYAGIYIAATALRQPMELRRFLGTALLAQAGAAIALASIAVHRNPAIGGTVQVVILGSVVVFEIIGPILIRESVMRAGEVPIGHAIHHTSRTFRSEAVAIGQQFLAAIGIRPRPSDPPGETLVSSLMRRGVTGIDQSASFDEVLTHMENSQDNTYPVIDAQQCVVGLIRYSSLSNVMFDNAISPLVRAEDLATPTRMVLYPDESASRARHLFQLCPDDCLPVVARGTPERMLGVVRRRDVMQLIIQQARN